MERFNDHTELPWSAYDADNHTRARKEDAEFAAHACNSHYELLHAAKLGLTFAEIKFGNLDPDANKAFEIIRAAIAKAEPQ